MKRLIVTIAAAFMGFLGAANAQDNVTVLINPSPRTSGNHYGLWTDSGISLTNGEWVTINADGFWTINSSYYDYTIPDGLFDGSRDLFLGNGTHGSLIAYAGPDPFQGEFATSFFPQSSNYWAVGTSVQFQYTGSTNAELWLGFNHAALYGDYTNDQGSATATIFQGFNAGPATNAALTVSLGLVTTNVFSFSVSNGIPKTACAVYDSSDLTHWTLIDAMLLDTNGTSQYAFSLLSVNSATLNPLGNGFYTNNTGGVQYRFYKVSNGQFWSRTIGFVQIPIAPYSTNLIANQLESPNGNTLNGLFYLGFGHTMIDGIALPAGVYFSQFSDTLSDTISTLGGSGWSPNLPMEPGTNIFLINPTNNAFTVVFAGLVQNTNGVIALPPSGYSFVSSEVPRAGGVQSVLGYHPEVGDNVVEWTSTGYDYITYFGNSDPVDFPTGWGNGAGASVPEPVITVGEGFLIQNNQSSEEYWTNTVPLNY